MSCELIHVSSLFTDQKPSGSSSKHINNREHYDALVSNNWDPSVFFFFFFFFVRADYGQHILLRTSVKISWFCTSVDNDLFAVLFRCRVTAKTHWITLCQITLSCFGRFEELVCFSIFDLVVHVSLSMVIKKSRIWGRLQLSQLHYRGCGVRFPITVNYSSTIFSCIRSWLSCCLAPLEWALLYCC